MSIPAIIDGVVCTTTGTPGTGAVTLNAAVTSCLGPSALTNAQSYYYTIQDADANGNPNGGREWGIGTYTESGTSLSRDTVLGSTNSGSKVSFLAGARVFFSPPKRYLDTWWLDLKRDFGAKGDGVSGSDRVAFNAAIAFACVYGASLTVPRGIYDVSGGGITIPYSSDQFTGIKLLGAAPPCMGATVVVVSPPVPLPVGGTIIQSSDTTAIMGGESAAFTAVMLDLENICFRNTGGGHGLDLYWVSMVRLKNIAIDAGNYNTPGITVAPSGTYGLRCPTVGNGAFTRLDGVMVVGFNDGITINEHTDADSLTFFACVICLFVYGASHGSYIKRMLAQECQQGIYFAGAPPEGGLNTHRLRIGQYAFEHNYQGPSWQAPFADVSDPNNYGIGGMEWVGCFAGAGGYCETIGINGAASFTCTPI